MSRRGAEESDRMIEQALCSGDPVRALWRFLTDPSRVAISLEFLALANHRKAVRAHMAEHCEEMRRREVEIFTRVLGERVAFPSDFVGRGDMSRGGLMLRCVDEGRELSYVSLVGATRHGPRPARLPAKPRAPR